MSIYWGFFFRTVPSVQHEIFVNSHRVFSVLEMFGAAIFTAVFFFYTMGDLVYVFATLVYMASV